MAVSRKYTPVLMGLTMGLFMSFLMSLVISYVNVGLVEDFLFVWMRAWAAGIVISIPIAIVVFPMARRIVNRFTE